MGFFNFTGMDKKQLSPEQALQKLKHYCGYQERSHAEVKDKLFQLGVWKKDHDQIIASLIEENYLNEERFALAYATGKFRMKQWGKVRIRYELKQKQVSDYLIRKALNQINDDDYYELLQKLTIARYDSLKGEQWLVRKKKTVDYLLQKGFEAELINRAMSEINQP